MKKSLLYPEVALHLIYWIIYISLPLLSRFQHTGHSDFTIEDVLRILFCLIVAYTSYFFLLPYFTDRKRFVQLSILEVGLVAATAYSFSIIHKLLEKCQCVIWHMATQEFFSFFSIVLFFTCLFIIKKYLQEKQLLEHKEKVRLETELKFLKSQISPHYLFNNLNTLYSYALEDSKEVPNIILKLSDGLRYMLYESENDKTSIKSELMFIQNYIDLQKLRTANRIIVHTNISMDWKVRSLMIAPSILLPFVENAFKHSIDSLVEQPEVNISVRVSGKQLYFYCSNTYSPEVKTSLQEKEIKSGGIGLENVKKRLDIMYPGQHELKIEKGKSQFLVELTISL